MKIYPWISVSNCKVMMIARNTEDFRDKWTTCAWSMLVGPGSGKTDNSSPPVQSFLQKNKTSFLTRIMMSRGVDLNEVNGRGNRPLRIYNKIITIRMKWILFNFDFISSFTRIVHWFIEWLAVEVEIQRIYVIS